MRCAPVILLFCLSSTGSALATGCQQPAMSEQEKADIRDSFSSRSSQTVMQPKSALLIEGLAPLVYMSEESGTIHIVDSSSGATLATAQAARGTLVRIDPVNGVYVGERLIHPGPLVAGHHFDVMMDLNSQSEWRTGLEAPKPAPPPATRPGNQQQKPSF